MDKNQQVVCSKDPASDLICSLPNSKQAITQRHMAKLSTTCNRKNLNYSVVLLTKPAENQKFSQCLNTSLETRGPTYLPATLWRVLFVVPIPLIFMHRKYYRSRAAVDCFTLSTLSEIHHVSHNWNLGRWVNRITKKKQQGRGRFDLRIERFQL